jgi:hypothetical protein
VLESHPLLGRIGGRPARARTERIEILMDVEVPQHVGRLIPVADVRMTTEYAARLIQLRLNRIRDPLLPVGRVGSEESEDEKQHGPVNLACSGPESQGKDDDPLAFCPTMSLHTYQEDSC